MLGSADCNTSSIPVPAAGCGLADNTIESRDTSLGGLDLDDRAAGIEDGDLA